MPSFDFIVSSEISKSSRVKQLSAMFDVPPMEKASLQFKGDLPIDDFDWNVGLIVGPSGCGKSSIVRRLFGDPVKLNWSAKSVIDDFSRSLSIEQISRVCQSVGFNTIPAWIRPFSVLSNGEKFRVELARHLLEGSEPIVIDEFSSVVDRQVAKIGSHAIQKHVRRNNQKFIAATCHYDVLDWLQPDWVFEPATMAFARRSLQRRPSLDVAISRVPYSAWQLFAPFHYLTNELHKAARCFALFVENQIASFAGNLYRPHPKVRDIIGCSRLVTLPDYQGLGLAMILVDKLGAALKTIGKRYHTYPAHPSLIRSFDKSPNWHMERKPGSIVKFAGAKALGWNAGMGGTRPCAVFSYCGRAMDNADAQRLLNVV